MHLHIYCSYTYLEQIIHVRISRNANKPHNNDFDLIKAINRQLSGQ
jgi:hypothetical protein